MYFYYDKRGDADTAWRLWRGLNRYVCADFICRALVMRTTWVI